MEITSALVRGASASLVIRLLNIAFLFGSSVILARILSPAGYGTYSFVVALVTVASIPVHFGLPTLVMREVALSNARESWGLMRGLIIRAHQLVLLTSLLMVAIVGFVLLYFPDLLPPIMRSTLFWGLSLVPLGALAAIRSSMLRGLGKVVLGLWPEQVLQPALLCISLLVSVFVLKDRGIGPTQAMALNVLATGCAFIVGLWLFLKVRPAKMKEAAAVYDTTNWSLSLLPLGFSAGLYLINSYADVLLLGIFSSSSEVGIYRVASQAAFVVSIGYSAINVILSPHFAKSFAGADKVAMQRFAVLGSRLAVSLSLPIVLVYFFFGESLLSLFFGKEYINGYRALVILSVAQLLNSAMGSVAILLNMTRNERVTTMGMGIAAMVNILLNIALIPNYGATGAAIASAVSLCLWNLLLRQKTKQLLGFESAFWGRIS